MVRKLVRLEPEPEEKPEEPEPLLYNVEAAGRILGGISVAMVYKYVAKKRLRPVKIGTRTMFTMDELQRFVKEREGRPSG